MAQTKTKSKAKPKSSTKRSGSSSNGSSGSSRTKAKSKAKSNGSSGSSRAKVKSSGKKATGKTTGKAAQASNGVADSVKRGASGIAPLARKAKVPLVASGAALAGVAGAIVATRTAKHHNHKVLGISLPKNGISMPKPNGMKTDAKKISGAVVDAAKRADRFGQGVSRVASSVRDAGEAADKVAKKS